jgi:HTH-type transcriptional regulator/antitoxin HigA
LNTSVITMAELATSFDPDWVSPPGDTIAELLEERGWSHQELAQRIDYSAKHISQLINGKVPLTDDAAARLNSVLGAPIGFWLTREANYRERLARLDARARFASWQDWLDEIPVRQLMDLGKIEKCRIDARSRPRIVEQCLAFFGVASPDAWRARYGGLEVHFCRSREEQSDLGAISAWLRLGEQQAEARRYVRYDEARFKSTLRDMRSLSVLPLDEMGVRLQTTLADSGVVLVLAPSINGSHVSGVARWLNANRPLIQLTLNGKTNDTFWFTLFHEAAHILLHSRGKKSKETLYLDDPGHSQPSTDREREANAWAKDWLIPRTLMSDSKTNLRALRVE